MKEKHNPFIVPEGYFDNFTVEMMARIDAYEESGRKTQRAKKVSLSDAVRRYTRYAIGVAVSVAFFAVITKSAPVEKAAPQPVDKSVYMQASASDQVYDYMDLNANNVYDYVSTID